MVKKQKVSSKLYQRLKRTPKFQKALGLLVGDIIYAKASFKLYVHGDAIVLLRDPENKLGPQIMGYEVDIVGTLGDIIIVAICQCVEGSDDCQFVDTDNGTECMGSVCGDCRGGFEVWGPMGGIPEVVTPF